MDIDPKQSTDQTFVLSSTLSPDGNTLTITDVDAPYTGWPANAQNGVTEDVEFQADLYLVWRWIQNVNGQNVSVFYPLALTLWWVNFYAKGAIVMGVPTKPINNIIILNGVGSLGSNTWAPSNKPPEALDMTRIFNGNNQWQ